MDFSCERVPGVVEWSDVLEHFHGVVNAVRNSDFAGDAVHRRNVFPVNDNIDSVCVLQFADELVETQSVQYDDAFCPAYIGM